jgi:hypothetical protein
MAVNGGRLAVGIGTGAAGGASTGMMFGPWGAAIGGGIGALGGALGELLSSSDEAKQRKKALEQYRQQTRDQRAQYEEQRLKQSGDDWERRMVALTPGLANDPMYIADSYEQYQPEPFPSLAKEEEDFNARMPVERAPNYGQLVNSLGSLGSTVGGAVRQGDAQSRLDELIQSRKIGQTGNPWQNYADTQQDDELEKMLAKARGDAWNRTGGW